MTFCLVVTSNLIGSQRFRWRFRIDQEITNVISQGRYGQCLVTTSIPWRGAMYNEYHLGFMKWQSFSKNTKSGLFFTLNNKSVSAMAVVCVPAVRHIAHNYCILK